MPDFTLLDDRLFVAEDELDGVFKRDDVIGVVLIDVLDDRGHRGALADTRPTGDQDQPVGQLGQPQNRGGQFQVNKGRHILGHVAHGGAERGALVVEVDGEVYELTGSAEVQYKQWRSLMREIYASETGLDSFDSGLDE